MSLNGLHDAKVTEAYQGALAEGGGWFLLKYASRDEVEVLARGTGGAAEARGAVAQYEEKSPLYGFLLYRRRKVLIKYVPDGTSRLLQARVAVHFTAVSEKFTPHDTNISITSADELSDSALASACSLHTAAPSNCSSSTSSRRKLDEITEDAEEGQGPYDDTASLARPSTAASSKPTITGLVPTETKSSTRSHETSTTNAAGLDAAEDAKGTLPLVAVDTVHESEQPEFNVSQYRDSLKGYDSLFEHGPDPRMSSQTARPAMSDLYAEIYAQYKPKVKLGPRPRPSLDSKRPHTSGPGAQNVSRPVSTLPAGMRLANRKNAAPKRPKSRETSTIPSIAFPPPPPVPAVPEMPLPSPTYAPKSSASVRYMPIHGHNQRNTVEKQRLMKALELRKKQMKARQEKVDQDQEVEIDHTDAGAQAETKVAESSVTHDSSAKPIAENTASSVVEPVEPKEELVSSDPVVNENAPVERTSSGLLHEDSALHLTSSRAETDDLHSAASACSPTSAQTHGSSCAPSTRPSSISEEAISEPDIKAETSITVPTLVVEGAPEFMHHGDEKESVDSSPTVVPDTNTPIQSIDGSEQQATLPSPDAPAFLSDGALQMSSKRESTVMLSAGQQESRRSKRESTIFLPAEDSSRHGEAATRRAKRESVIFSPAKRSSFIEGRGEHRVMVDPVQFQASAENSEAEYLSDDSFMAELKSAKVEEAKPMFVSKSPITPFFPRKKSVSEATTPERSASQQYKPGRFSPEQTMPRKSSGPWLAHANSDTAVMAKKINVSSGISQRIKALAEKSNRDSSASVSPVATPDASISIATRKSSFFASPSAGSSPNLQATKRLSHASFANLSNTSTPDRKSVLQPPTSREGPPAYSLQPAFQKPESVQVTARIVRDGRARKPALTMPNENTPLDLHQSQIIIDHQKSALSTPKSPIKQRTEPTSPRPPSSSHSKEIVGLPRTSSESSWRSFGRRLSESKSEARSTRSLSAHSFDSAEEKREEKKEKRDSRTSKFFKRMSSIAPMPRKDTIGSLQEEDMQCTSLPSVREPPPAVQVGDLNVQFPDTLLWKRRWVEIDAMGNLVLSLSKSNEQSKGITKRFHLSEFSTPYAPDQDRQELPNSVILDFLDGRALQCACETYVAQAQVLQILREAHDAWIAYKQGI